MRVLKEYPRCVTIRQRMRDKYYRLVGTPTGRVAHILVGIRGRCRRADIEFGITISDLLPLPRECPIFGVALEYGLKGKKGYHANSPSVDRIDPTLGYIPGNVWIISQRANCIKNDGTSAEHRLIAAAMDAHRFWRRTR